MLKKKEKMKRLHEKALWVDKETHRLILVYKAVNGYKTISEAIKSLIDFHEKHKEEAKK